MNHILLIDYIKNLLISFNYEHKTYRNFSIQERWTAGFARSVRHTIDSMRLKLIFNDIFSFFYPYPSNNQASLKSRNDSLVF